MGNEEKWSMQETVVGLNMLNYLDNTKGMPGDSFAIHLIPLLLVAQGTDLNNLLFVNREYERPLHIMTASGQNAEVLEEVVNSQANKLPYAERTMLKEFSRVLRKTEMSKS